MYFRTHASIKAAMYVKPQLSIHLRHCSKAPGFKLTFQSCIVKNLYRILLVLVLPKCTLVALQSKFFGILYAVDCWKMNLQE